jgi:hypothetical protein
MPFVSVKAYRIAVSAEEELMKVTIEKITDETRLKDDWLYMKPDSVSTLVQRYMRFPVRSRIEALTS